jgi:hypothetical protein
MEGFENKWLVIGYDTIGNLFEIAPACIKTYKNISY